MADQVYLKCSAKEKTGRFGPVLTLGVKVADLIAFANEHQNERGYLNLVITKRKEIGQYGDTHSVKLDSYTPRQGNGDVPF